MSDAQLSALTISHAAGLIRSGDLSPRILVEDCLARIQHLNPMLNAFLAVMADQALREARQAEEGLARGEHWGPLHGIPIAVKDTIDIAGERTTAGSLFLRDNLAADDADVILQLRAAGAILIGKTLLDEFSVGATTVNPHYGPARNPWNPEMSPGGSSGGSAVAVAASMCLGALGGDTGGSVRVPSALCGLTGLRPGKGRISTRGAVPMSWTVDTIGPMAHTAYDAALLLDALDNQPLSPARAVAKLDEPVRGLRVGLPQDDFFWLESDHEVVMAVRTAAEALVDLGMTLVETTLPMVKDARRATTVLIMADAAAYHQQRLESEPEKFGDPTRTRLEWGAKRTGVEYAQARQTGREWRAHLRSLFRDQFDVLLLPTTSVAAHTIEGSEGVSAARDLLRFTYPITLSAMPGLSAPCGFTRDGLPIGMQLVAPSDATVLHIAHAYQQATGWHARRPELS